MSPYFSILKFKHPYKLIKLKLRFRLLIELEECSTKWCLKPLLSICNFPLFDSGIIIFLHYGGLYGQMHLNPMNRRICDFVILLDVFHLTSELQLPYHHPLPAYQNIYNLFISPPYTELIILSSCFFFILTTILCCRLGL